MSPNVVRGAVLQLGRWLALWLLLEWADRFTKAEYNEGLAYMFEDKSPAFLLTALRREESWAIEATAEVG